MRGSPGGGRGLLVVLTVAERTYGIPAGQVVELLPDLPVQPLALAPPSVTGVLDHRGTMIPVIDLARVLEGRESTHWLASRIVVVAIGGLQTPRPVGLLAEGCALQAFDETAVQAGLHLADAPFLGPLLPVEDRVVQLIDPELLLPADVLDTLLGRVALTRHDR